MSEEYIKGMWTTKGGRRLRIVDMTSEHIRACITLLNRTCLRYINSCMCINEDWEIPDYIKDKIEELEEELDLREKNGKTHSRRTEI